MLSSTTCARNGTVAPPSRFRIERMERRLSPTPGAFKLSTPGLVPLTDGGFALGASGPGTLGDESPIDLLMGLHRSAHAPPPEPPPVGTGHCSRDVRAGAGPPRTPPASRRSPGTSRRHPAGA